MTAFEEMGIMPEIAGAVEEMEWLLPTDIQSEAIPLILGGGDVLMAAETGSGKTGAFCLPVLQIVWETINEKPSHRKPKNASTSDDWLLSSVDLDVNLSLSSDLLAAQSKGANTWQGCRANKGVTKSAAKPNRFYYEVRFTDPGLARIGWSLSDGSLDLGTDKHGWGYGGTAKKSNSRNFEGYGDAFGDKFDVIGNVIDLNAGTILWTKNGKDLGVAFKLPNQLHERNPFFPTICVKNAGVTVHFKSTDKPPLNCIWIGDADQSQVVQNPNSSFSSSKNKTKDIGPKAIIIEPSRELAQQTYNCIVSFKKHLSGQLRVLLLIGGGNAKDQIAQIEAGVEIVVATPGRLDELVNSSILSLSSCRFFIVDEIDALLQQGQTNLITKLHCSIPRMFEDGKRLQMIVCSATLHNFDVKKLAEKLMFFPTWVDLKGEDSIPDTVHHVVLRVDPNLDTQWKTLKSHITTDMVHTKDNINPQQPNKETLSEAIKILKGEYIVKAIDSLKINQAIIFCRTKVDCDNLENYFNNKGGKTANNPYSCVCLHSDRKPQERTDNLTKFKKGLCNFLICTDVAARGIDITGVPFVIQVTLPDEKSNYLHRIGRVGRAERMGLALSLVSTVPEKVWYHSNCSTKGKGCYDTRLVEQKGCCIWYNELNLLGEIEDNLNCIVQEIKTDFKIQVNEFDGKVTYGEKNKAQGYVYDYHVKQLSNVVSELAQLEANAQNNYLKFYASKNII